MQRDDNHETYGSTGSFVHTAPLLIASWTEFQGGNWYLAETRVRNRFLQMGISLRNPWVSGHETKLDDPLARYLATTFCYGCNLGLSQTARSLKGFDRRQVSWVNQHHITEEKLDEAIRSVITGYNRFHLPKYWGTGKRASADGTKWEMYEQNLLVH